MPTEREWGWYPERGGTAYGGHSTKEAAIAEARRDCADMPRHNVRVGPFTKLDPADWVPDNADDVLDRMSCAIVDNLGLEDANCNLRDADEKDQAERELADALRAWVSKWVECECERYIDADETELVEVGSDAD